MLRTFFFVVRALDGRGTAATDDGEKRGHEGCQDVLGHENGHKICRVVVQVAQELSQSYGVLLGKCGQLLRVFELVVEKSAHL